MFVVKCFVAVLVLDLANFAAVFAQLTKDDVITTSTITTSTRVVPEKILRAGEASEIMCSRYARQTQRGKNRLCASKLKQPISGGRSQAAPKEFPYMAAIGYDSSESTQWNCGGSVISENFVLTTSSCLTTMLGQPKWVRVGDFKLTDITYQDARSQVRGVADIITYPKYRRNLKYYDIGLLKLDRPLTFDDYFKPACLSLVPRFPDGHNVVEVVWNRDLDDDRYEMWKNDVSMISFAQCNSFYRGFSKALPNGIDYNSQFCGLHANTSCLEDFGGSLIAHNIKEECMYDIIGIASSGISCSQPIYSKVNYYVSWIESIVWPNLS